jgi:hypothetical protein
MTMLSFRVDDAEAAEALRRRVRVLSPARMAHACRVVDDSLGC